MADPLSIIASIIAVLGAAESAGKALNRIRDMMNAPDEVLALGNEISDLTVVLKHVETYVTGANGAFISLEHLEHISLLVKRAHSKLAQLEQIMHNHLPESRRANRRRSPLRLSWALLKTKVNGLRVDLRDIKLSMIVQISTVTRYVITMQLLFLAIPIDILVARSSQESMLLSMRFCSLPTNYRTDKPGCAGKLNLCPMVSSITCCKHDLGPCDRLMAVARIMEILELETIAGFNPKHRLATQSPRLETTKILAFLSSESGPMYRNMEDIVVLLLANALVIQFTDFDHLLHSTRSSVSYSLATAVL